jgi:HAD superfamily hydrolase (TIGR01509 family)
LDKITTLARLLDRARGIIFDFDGLLADSERYHFLSYSEVFARHGHTIDEKEYYKYWTSLGHGARGEIERHGLDLDPADIIEKKRPIFSRYCRDGSIRFYPEAREMVKLFADSGRKLAIASGSHRADIEAILENEGLRRLFPVIVGKDDVSRTKPDPEVFIKTIGLLELQAGDCLVLEDAEKGLQAAKAAGIPIIVVRSPETRAFDFPGADLVVDGLDEMMKLTGEIEW